MITTDDDDMAAWMRAFINHGEMSPFSQHLLPGLNLRPTELSAVLAISQLARIDELVHNLDWIARRVTDNMPSQFTPLPVRDGCKSGRYCYAFAVPAEKRDKIADFLTNHGVPAMPMYRPLYELPAFIQWKRDCPNAVRMSETLVVFELTLWRYEDDISLVGVVLRKAAEL